MQVKLVRIDSRLLHGQVAIAWTKQVRPDRIMVVSDGVAKDELRRTLITHAAPPGTKANVVPVDKFIQILGDDRFANVKVLVLFENPQDLQKVVEAVPDFTKKINVGSMAHSDGKTAISQTVSVSDHDVAAYKFLKERGIAATIQKVPSDGETDIHALLAKKGF